MSNVITTLATDAIHLNGGTTATVDPVNYQADQVVQNNVYKVAANDAVSVWNLTQGLLGTGHPFPPPESVTTRAMENDRIVSTIRYGWALKNYKPLIRGSTGTRSFRSPYYPPNGGPDQLMPGGTTRLETHALMNFTYFPQIYGSIYQALGAWSSSVLNLVGCTNAGKYDINPFEPGIYYFGENTLLFNGLVFEERQWSNSIRVYEGFSFTYDPNGWADPVPSTSGWFRRGPLSEGFPPLPV